MKLSNFKRHESLKRNTNRSNIFDNKIEIATVDITTGFLWAKKTVTREIFREWLEDWRFSMDGSFVPREVSVLATAYDVSLAKQKALTSLQEAKDLACA